ncbi:hypothetical protein ACEPAH_6261 [Sanghuangporus vaninii]
MSPRTAPKVLSAPRLITLVSSIVVALCAGTNYVFSAYAPQLAARLRISHTKLNVIGLAGNIGVYSTGPFWGRIVDRRGPRILLACGFAFLLAGYSGMRYFYNSPDDGKASAEKLSHLDFASLTLCAFLTGAGGNGGLTAAVNASAKSFPDAMRASATGFVISGFGLSAFFFSGLARILYPDDTSSFLLLLALGTSFPMIIGFFLVRPIPLPSEQSHQHPHLQAHEDFGSPIPTSRRLSTSEIPHDGFAHSAGVDVVFGNDSVIFEYTNDSQTTLLATHHHRGHQHVHIHDQHHQHRHPGLLGESEYVHRDHDASMSPARGGRSAVRAHSIEFAVSPPPRDRRYSDLSAVSHNRSRSRGRVIEVMRDIHGKALLRSGDFWLMFTIMSLLIGTGLMYINNVGLIAQALFAKGDPDFDAIQSAKWQSLQVSIISIANCAGRILNGVAADLVKNRLGAPRSYCIVIVAVLFVLSQVLVGLRIEDVNHLWQASSILGLAYGGLFGLFPTITIEWFGLSHFSENWGFVCLSPLLGSNLFSLAFGHNLDSHSPPTNTPGDGEESKMLLRSLRWLRERAGTGLPPGEQCFAGRDCYVSSIYLTIGACSFAALLSAYAAWKDRRRMTIKPADYEEILWEEDDEDEGEEV